MTGMQLFQILKTGMGEPETHALISFMDTQSHNIVTEMQDCGLRTLATKEELGDVTRELTRVESRLEVKIAQVEGRLDVKIAEVKSDVIRWMFAFFITMLLAILGLYFKK